MKTLLLGLGNELYGDDGVGLHVARRLKEEAARAEVEIEESSVSGLALLDVVVGYDRLIIIDTIKRAAPVPGKVHILGEPDIRAIPGPSPHYVSIPQMLEIGRRAGLHVPSRIQVVAVEAKDVYRLGEGLSAEIQETLPVIIQKVKDLLRAG